LTAQHPVTYISSAMKRTVLYILLLANLFSGLALAWDSHPEAMVGHEQISFDHDQATANPYSHEHDHFASGDWEHANHCCHGAAHLIGFINEIITPLWIGGGKHPPYPSASLLSPPLAPHLRPPII